MDNLKKVILGTVQFGVDYGISNTEGKTDFDEAMRILSLLKEYGINTFDTAPAYGVSEDVVSEYSRLNNCVVYSKIDGINQPVEQVIDSLNCTVDRFPDCQLNLLFHDAKSLVDDQYKKVLEITQDLKERGVIKEVGCSLYSPSDLTYLMKLNIDCVQIPFNVFDQRFRSKEFLDWKQDNNVKVFSRSVFLQGLLIMDPSTITGNMAKYSSLVQSFQLECEINGLSPYRACLEWAFRQTWIDKVVIGLNSLNHARTLIDSVLKLNVDSLFNFEKFRTEDLNLINPGRW